VSNVKSHHNNYTAYRVLSRSDSTYPCSYICRKPRSSKL